jgi:glycopeptide antibiotics resistance protein
MLITINKEHLRPAAQDHPFCQVITGCFPNFIAAYLISLAMVVGMLVRKPRYSRIIVYSISLLIFCVLALEEIKPMWGASEHYDIFDIIASGLGSVLAIFTYEIASSVRNQKKQTRHN